MFPKTYWYVLITYFLMFVFTAFAPFLFLLFTDNVLTAITASNVIGFVLALIIVLKLMKPYFQEEKLQTPVRAGYVIGWVFIGLFLAFLSQSIAGAIESDVFGIKPGSENTETIVNISREVPLFLIIPAIVGPILEEIVFRKILFGTFYKKWNFFIATLLSALIFALAHMDFTHTLIYFAMGVVFSFLYIRTKRILVPILVHISMNSLVVIAQLSIDPELIEEMQKEVSLILFGG